MMQSYPVSRPKASRILREVFDLEGATALGGLNRLARFVGRLGINRKLAKRFRSTKAAWSTWPLDRVLRVMLDASFAGLERLYHFEDLETEPLLCTQHGVERLPDLKTLYRDLRRFEDKRLLVALHELLREVVVEALARQKRIVLDIDSTVETLYGRQQGAELGHNPHKRNRPSYHPLLARERLSDLLVNHRLRPGNTGTASGVVPFLHQTLDIVKQGQPEREILVRADPGFETERVLRLLERRGVGYVIKMRGTFSLTSVLTDLSPRRWRRVELDGDGEVEVTSFSFQRPSWRESRRIVVVRKRDMDELQGHLFDEFGWSYSFFVTDRDWPGEEVARFYDKRADVERTVCEAKNDLLIDHVPTASFGANAADLALKVLARNLLVLYRDRDLRLKQRIRIMTLRRRFILIAGRIVRHAGRLVLRLAAHSPLQGLAAARAPA